MYFYSTVRRHSLSSNALNVMETTNSAEAKRVPLEALSKEELLQKCKALLSIAQRAKVAKDDALKETQSLKNEVENLKKLQSKDEATAELIEALTSQKLQLTIELDGAKRESRNSKTEIDELRVKIEEQEVQIESLRRQLNRSESDCSALESRLERLDSENHRLASVANEAEAQLRRGAVERQDALEGLGDELANVKNAAAEALAERDRLKAQLQQQAPNNNFQVLESCQLLVQELRSTQSLLRSDVSELQNAAQVMALDLGEALAESQAATEEAARHNNKDLLAEMNEAMKTRGEVAAQLAEKLSSVEREKDTLTEATQEHLKTIKTLEEQCLQKSSEQDALHKTLKGYEEKFQVLQQSQNEASQKITALLNTCKEKELHESELLKLQEENNLLIAENKKLEIQINEKEISLNQHSSDLESNQAELLNSKKEIVTLQEKLKEFDTLITENSKLKDDLNVLQLKINENLSLISKLEDLESELLLVKKERETLIEEMKHYKSLSEASNTEEVIQEVQTENQELKKHLLEQSDKNKKMEETISALEKKVMNSGTISNENQKLQQINLDLKQHIEKLEQSAIMLKDELAFKQQSSEQQLEVLRFEIKTMQSEKDQLADTVTNLEKLKIEVDSVKEMNANLSLEVETLNKQNSDLTQELEKKVAEDVLMNCAKVAKELEELSNKNKELLSANQSLREKLAELEREREECDGASVSTVSRTEDSARLRDVEESFEDRYTKLRAVAVKLKQKCQDQAGVLTKVLSERTELQNKLAACCKDRDALAKNLQSMQAACDAATDESEAAQGKVQQCNKELKRAGEELAQARNQYAEAVEKSGFLEAKLQHALAELDAAKQDNKKSNVLNLEMAAYERSAAEQDRKLAQLKEEVQSLTSQLENQKSIASQNLKEAKQWEENCKQLTTDKTKAEDVLAQTKIQLSEIRDELASQSQKLSESVARYEAKHSELERLELQLAELTSEKVKRDEAAKNFQEQAARQIRILEDQVSSMQNTVKSRDDDLTTLQAEFEGYKVRAQAVLHRQQQKHQTHKEDLTKEAERESELALLKSTVERLQTALSDSGDKEKSLQAEISVLTGHNSALQTSARSLATQVTELNSKCEDLKNKLMKGEETLRDTNRQHRLALDTLSRSYKQQLADAEKRHKTQIANLQAAQEEIKEQHSLIEHEQQPVLQQREEGEGSENVDSPKANVSMDSRKEPLPLERLLSSSSDYPDDIKSETSLDAASMTSVLAAEKRAKHLAALLGEAEADLARLTQQNFVLKEEIRRQQRSVERQQHTLSNGEYLKNVVLKFVTLQGGDERARLVPVLNTILKLSPEETQQLQLVATGSAPAAPGSASASSSGWGSYLHLWSGTH
ncbi:hypothetical protein B566_EDAN017298 [Ephemera danica]|nr:hypothetical protein B566_EDAN017298 [Ephemera danica]